jgi:hypothetical protein
MLLAAAGAKGNLTIRFQSLESQHCAQKNKWFRQRPPSQNNPIHEWGISSSKLLRNGFNFVLSPSISKPSRGIRAIAQVTGSFPCNAHYQANHPRIHSPSRFYSHLVAFVLSLKQTMMSQESLLLAPLTVHVYPVPSPGYTCA